MKTYLFTGVALCSLAALSGCKSPVAQLPNPNLDEASKAIGRLLTLEGDRATWRIPEGQPTSCVAGKTDNTEVRSCKVCASVVYIEQSWTGARAVAKREVFDVAFKRAVSFDQPDIAPSDAASGVWVAALPSLGPYTQQISRSLVDQRGISPQAVAAATGYTISGYYTGTKAPIWTNNGYPAHDDDVYSALLNTNILSGSEISGLKSCPAV